MSRSTSLPVFLLKRSARSVLRALAAAFRRNRREQENGDGYEAWLDETFAR